MVETRTHTLTGDPLSELETALIDEFFHARGIARHDLIKLSTRERTRIWTDACTYASARLTELESRAHYVSEIRHASEPEV